MKPLYDSHIHCITYGSIARGDIHDDSDIDIFIPNPPSEALIEAAINRAGIHIRERVIVQATPSYAAKANLIIDELTCYSFPLVELKANEAEFYSFAGSLNYVKLNNSLRIPGVDKRLMLIVPMEKGHRESSIVGKEGYVAKILNVSTNIVNERIRILGKRERHGRTGLYLKRVLSPNESISTVVRELSASRPALRRRIRN
jgi:predicted nucleotidyltransferase